MSAVHLDLMRSFLMECSGAMISVAGPMDVRSVSPLLCSCVQPSTKRPQLFLCCDEIQIPASILGLKLG